MRILITSGPTREYLDPVRFLTNASSGRMGCAVAQAALEAGHEVVIVSGPVEISYPAQAQVIWVITTQQMCEACLAEFDRCDGVIAVAAPCDYRPVRQAKHKWRKTGRSRLVRLVETPDILAHLAMRKRHQWMVGFALETRQAQQRAWQKLQQKHCDLMVVNGPAAMHAPDTHIDILDPQGQVVASLAGPKQTVARQLFQIISDRLIRPNR
ncbi:MAG: phosphopantothenoylcysteine decarboxylase [Thermoguttaceae bacterium]|nr:phosphopantothenoylcysteine decarboxylase [Thermoguttaceae bacterium]MDW8037672.1 phosphopantothenoylcysteine decarboxylase [Thermoguttaceae bacterium]